MLPSVGKFGAAILARDYNYLSYNFTRSTTVLS